MRRISLLLVVAMVVLGPAGPAVAQDSAIRVEVIPYPAEVIPAGGAVSFTVLLLLPADEPATITAIGSDLYGNVTDPANPALLETTCVVPSIREPGDIFGAYDWGCEYRVWIEGDPGEITDTVTVTVVRADETEAVTATTVSVSISTDTGAIRGTITDDVTGAPIAEVWVDALGPGDGLATTDAAGRYSIDALPPGEYRLLSGNTPVWPSIYAREWWDDAADSDSAGVVTVVGGEVTTVDWALSLGGVIEGTVTDQVTGAPIPGVSVSWVAVYEDGTREGAMGGFSTTEDGTYMITGLHEADYLICFNADGYERECWDDRTDFGSGLAGRPGDPVAAAPRTVVSGIDATLASQTPPPTPTTSPGPAATLPFTGIPPAAGWAALAALGALIAGGAALVISRSPSRAR